MPSWHELLQPGHPKAAQESPENARFNELCGAVFTSGGGKELLEAMRVRTIEYRTPARAHEAQLREDEAVRRFVASLEIARDRGLETLSKQKSKPSAS